MRTRCGASHTRRLPLGRRERVYKAVFPQLLHQFNALQIANSTSDLNGEPSKLEAQYAAHMQTVPPLPNIDGSAQVVRLLEFVFLRLLLQTTASTSTYYNGQQLPTRRFLPPRQGSDASVRVLSAVKNFTLVTVERVAVEQQQR